MQHYVYGDIDQAIPFEGEDGSRVISFFIFNTEVHIHAYGSSTDEERVDSALLTCRDRCKFFDEKFSRTRPESDISRAHACAPHPVNVAPETAELVERALEYCVKSEGAFDITMGTVTSLWDFHAGVVPSKLALSRALPHVNYENVAVTTKPEYTLALLDPDAILDLGGVAKGYIADDLARILHEHGIQRFVINLGGNVAVSGGRPQDEASCTSTTTNLPWKIGIVNPRDPKHHRAIVDVVNGSVVTSGLHERRFTRGGVTYHHILSAQDGMPVKTDVASATIVAERSIDCDGYSTTALMLGVAAGLDFIEAIPGVEAVFIDTADNVHWTSGLEDRLSLIPTLPQW